MRDIVLRGSLNSLEGGESYEAWLKPVAGAWSLHAEGDVVPGPTQDFIFTGLEDDTDYVAQIRLVREFRYRAGYLSPDPDTWPADSRFEFTSGHLLEAPTITATAWARTSGVAQHVSVDVSAAEADKDLELLADGVVVDTVAAPHVGTVVMTHANPAQPGSHVYTARHISGVIDGPESAPVTQWAGPAKPTGLAQVAPDTRYYIYEISWDNIGKVARQQDDYLCDGVYTTRGVVGVSADRTVTVEKDSAMDSNGNVSISCTTRVRYEVTTFAVVDVSDWTSLEVNMEIAPDETAHNSCP